MNVKTYDYIVTLKKGSTKHIDIIALFMLLLTYTALGWQFLHTHSNAIAGSFTNKHLYIVLASLITISLLLMQYKKLKLKQQVFFSKTLVIAALCWYYVDGLQWLAILFLVAAFLEKATKIAPEYAFDEDGITYNSFPTKHFNWNEIQNVVIKYGMLTIDFKNNKIVQKELDETISNNLETEFNNYCKEKIKLYSH